MTYQYILKENKSRKLLYGLAIANFTILLIGRIFFDFADVSPAKLDTHGNKAWAQKLYQEHPNTHKFFVNSYQNTASYWYYSKEQPFYYQNFTGRKNHFTLIQKNKNLDFPKILVGNRGRTLPNEIAFKDINNSLPQKFTYTISGTDQLKLNGVSLNIQLKKVPESKFRLLSRKYHWVNESTYNY